MKIKLKSIYIICIILASAVLVKDIFIEQNKTIKPTNIEKNKNFSSSNDLFSFYIDVYPPESKIMVMNIKPKYRQGMLLPKGSYDIKISKQGYYNKRLWIQHKDNLPHVIKLEKRGNYE
ncbi:hypothetical protein [Marinomonas algarum]|uniref:PEGA domain-containing protein n=1 Tax=Marinomonas algarum TaxID=2883105 RepID=A0A9X1LDI9_9GAMM|nr:hypothetical protein [Marinomonas algarum]MCB5162597.1 hypothetical protein [Marinomonas algarum]